MVVRVYLDTQDLTRMYHPRNEAHRLIADELLNHRSAGRALFYLSYWHVFEFLQPPMPGNLEDRRERARFLRELCHGATLPFFADVLDGRSELPGVWLPQEIIDKFTLRWSGQLEAIISQRTKGMSRAFRRKAASRGLMRETISKVFRGNEWERRQQIGEGLTDTFVLAAPVSRWFRGEISEDEVRGHIARLFCDPVVFYDQWYLRGDGFNPLPAQTESIAAQWVPKIEQIRSAAATYAHGRRRLVSARRDFYDRLRNSSLTDEMKAEAARKYPRPPPPLDLEEALNQNTPSPRLLYIACYLRSRLATPIKKLSDLVDLMHIFYLPEVDLLRCDRAMYNLMVQCPHVERDKLVVDFESLPRRIAALTGD